MLIDSHCHLNALSENEKKLVISACSQNHYLIDSSIDLESALDSLTLSKNHSFIYSSLGFHPFSGKKFSFNTLKKYEELINANSKIIAIGEIGLDYKAEIALDEQEAIFKKFIELAKVKDLPIIIHNRLPQDHILDVLDEFFFSYEKIIFHCFSYSHDFLTRIIEKNGFVSFSLNILRKKEPVFSALKGCPLENLLLETDSPYMRINNRRSTPLDIKQSYSFTSQIKGIEEKELEDLVLSNVKGVFRL